MPNSIDIAGKAALTIVESLLLALNDREVLPESEIMAILSDSANVHRHAAAGSAMDETHGKVAAMIQKIIDGGNSVRRR